MTTINSNERDLLNDDDLVAEMNTAAENLVGEWYRESQHRDELVEEVAVTLTATHRRAEANAATRMRNACVGKVREAIANLSRTSIAAEQNAREIDVLIKVREELKSVTLEAAANQMEQKEAK